MSVIKNKKELATSPLRFDALEILEAGYEAINTEKILRRKITFEDGELCIAENRYVCNRYDRIFFIGIGKCAVDGAKVIEDILGDALSDGIVIDIKSGGFKKIKSFVGTHPYPSKKNMLATEEVKKMVGAINKNDLLLVLISGGGSALLCDPSDLSCEEIVKVTKELTRRGADIYELNTVRKHLSKIQGGQLAEMARPAKIISLIFSDVLGNDISLIASGPTVLDNSTVKDAENILNKYNLSETCLPPNCKIIETPKDPKIFENVEDPDEGMVENILIATNQDALQAMKEKAENLGYKTIIETDRLSGKAREVGEKFANKNSKPKSCIIAGGETTVEIKGEGVGGRNQETALSALANIPRDAIFISVASDGFDNTPIAGAIADREILKRAKSLALDPNDYLSRNDSYNFFKKAGGGISTGLTGSNVSDLYIMLFK